MKNILILWMALLSVSAVYAQKTFQGKITYDYKMTGDNSSMASAFSPTSMDLLARKKGIIVRMNGGMMASMMGDMVTTKDGTVMINHNQKMAYDMDIKPEDLKDTAAPKIEKMDEEMEILGHKCQKYKVVSIGQLGETTTYVWVTEDFQLPHFKSQATAAKNFSIKDIPGVALKTQTSAMGMTVTQTATAIDQTKPKASEFKVPKGYERKKFDPKMFGIGGQ